MEKHLITNKMLSDALYSVNKKAKVYRDEKRIKKESEIKEKEMYRRKEILLSLLYPIYIHKEPVYDTVQVDSTDKDFYDRLLNAIRNDTVNWWSFYWKDKKRCYFFLEKTRLIDYNYYLFYPFQEHSYHLPITEDDLYIYEDLPILEIKNLVTKGEDNLLPIEEVDKIISWIKSNNYIFNGEITDEDLERHWDDAELSTEADNRLKEAYNYLNEYLKKGILMSGKPMQLSDDDKMALYEIYYTNLKKYLYKFDTEKEIRRHAKRFTLHLNQPVINTELIFSDSSKEDMINHFYEKTNTADKLIDYWNKKGCFKKEQELYKKYYKARKYCKKISKEINKIVIDELLNEKGIISDE